MMPWGTHSQQSWQIYSSNRHVLMQGSMWTPPPLSMPPVHAIVLRFLLTYIVIPPHFNQVESGVYWFHLVRPFVHPSICLFVGRIVSALYLQQYSLDPSYICTSYQSTSEGVACKVFLKILKLRILANSSYLLLWLCPLNPIWLNGMGNHEAAGILVVLVMTNWSLVGRKFGFW